MSALFLLLALPLCASASIDHDLSASVWGAGSLRQLSNSDLNPNNQSAQLPTRLENFEFRPTIKAFTENYKLTLRPRFMAQLDSVKSGDTTQNHHTALLRWSEASVHGTLSDTASFTYGLLNFQWGPAEAYSPSNKIFHDTIQQKDLLYETMGRHLLQFSLTPEQSWNETFLAEFTRNSEDELVYGESFEKKALLKSEISWSGGAQYLGVVVGWRERQKAWLGEYFNLAVLDGLSFYAEGGHEKGSNIYYPSYNATRGAYLFSQSKRNDQLFSSYTSGLRYEFVRGDDLRIEWVHQDQAYTEQERANAWTALTSPQLNQLQYLYSNAPRYRQNGLELPIRNLLYFSARVPNFFDYKDWTLYSRLLFSLLDSSKTVYLSSENAIGSHGSLLASLNATTGSQSSELKSLISFSGFLGYRHAW